MIAWTEFTTQSEEEFFIREATTLDNDLYQYNFDERGNAISVTNKQTGEVLGVQYTISPYFTKQYTPERLRQYNEKQKRGKAYYMKCVLGGLGQFIFENNKIELDLSPESIVRLVYLSTYMRYNRSELFVTQRKRMSEKDLPVILGVSESTARRFKNEVCPEYLQIDERGCLSINNEIFFFGKNANAGKSYQKIYVEAVRNLYRQTPTTQHKHLGYIFALLPYINIEYNVLCLNPYEDKLDNIELMTVKDFCDKIGYEHSNIKRLIKIYSSLFFEIEGKQMRFCSFVTDGKSSLDNMRIFINPRVLYSGSDYRKVEVLGAFGNETLS